MLALASVLPNPLLVTKRWNGTERPPSMWAKPPCDVAVVDAFDFLPSAEIVVIDSYRWVGELAPHFRKAHCLAVVDDLGKAIVSGVDVLINPNPGAESLTYRTDAQMLLGGVYALLRPEIWERRQTRTGPVRKVVVGKECPEWVRPLLAGYEVLEYGYPRDVWQAWDMLTTADLALVPASVTMLECLCLGIPTLGYAIAPNQRTTLAGLGWAFNLTPGSLATALRDSVWREHRSTAGGALIDGHGAVRVGAVLRARVDEDRIPAGVGEPLHPATPGHDPV